MRVGVIGTGQVGLVTAVTLADVGHDVGALDVDAETIETTFVSLALRGEPITVHGDGSQTRSLCYVDDLVEGPWRLFVSDLTGPVNLGNPEEVTVLELAERVRVGVDAEVPIEFTERPEDDPQVRRPDISLARLELGWEPKVPLDTGLERMVAWASDAWTT
jgi:nucleoside-diphosphate-sugar epimerase